MSLSTEMGVAVACGDSCDGTVSDVASRLPSSVGFSILWYSREVRQRCSAGSGLYGALYSARKVVKEQTRSGLASSDARASRAFITFLSIGFSCAAGGGKQSRIERVPRVARGCAREVG